MKAHRNIIFDVRLKAFSYDQEQDKPLSSLLFNPVLEVLTRTIRQEKEPSNWKGIELYLFMDNMLHIENSKESTWKLLGLVNKFNKVAG